jgi:hypothetical protein
MVSHDMKARTQIWIDSRNHGGSFPFLTALRRATAQNVNVK